MTKIVHSEIEGKSLNNTYWQEDVEALALEVEQLKAAPPADERVAELVEAAYREGRKDRALGVGYDTGWETSEAKAALAAGKGGG